MSRSPLNGWDTAFVGPLAVCINQYFNLFIGEHIFLWLFLVSHTRAARREKPSLSWSVTAKISISMPFAPSLSRLTCCKPDKTSSEGYLSIDINFIGVNFS